VVGIDPLVELTTHEGPDGWHVVQITGEIDLSTADRVAARFDKLIEAGTRHLIADLNEVTFIDSTGLAILVRVHNRVRQEDGDLIVVCGEGPAQKLLVASGLHRELTVRDSEPFVDEL
jgi:anti-sigma B factor antagonist